MDQRDHVPAGPFEAVDQAGLQLAPCCRSVGMMPPRKLRQLSCHLLLIDIKFFAVRAAIIALALYLIIVIRLLQIFVI